MNFTISIKSYQTRTKHTFNSNSFSMFSYFSYDLEGCKYARMRFHCTICLVFLRGYIYMEVSETLKNVALISEQNSQLHAKRLPPVTGREQAALRGTDTARTHALRGASHGGKSGKVSVNVCFAKSSQ